MSTSYLCVEHKSRTYVDVGMSWEIEPMVREHPHFDERRKLFDESRYKDKTADEMRALVRMKQDDCEGPTEATELLSRYIEAYPAGEFDWVPDYAWWPGAVVQSRQEHRAER